MFEILAKQPGYITKPPCFLIRSMACAILNNELLYDQYIPYCANKIFLISHDKQSMHESDVIDSEGGLAEVASSKSNSLRNMDEGSQVG